MSDHDTLYAAVLDQPDDDTPRLVLADWLDDRAGTVTCGHCRGSGEPNPKYDLDDRLDYSPGRTKKCPTCAGRGWVSDGLAERAEFVRVQCELVRSDKSACDRCGRPWDRVNKSSYPVPMSMCRQCSRDGPFWPDVVASLEMRKRQDELFGTHGATWFGPRACLTPPNEREERAGGEWLIVRRGMVDEVRCPLATWVGGPCGRCDGDGQRHGSERTYPPTPCAVCSGTGALPGIAAEVCRRHPVTRVALTDREPHSYGGVRWAWFSEEPRHPMSTAQDENRVPPAVYAELERHAGSYTVGRACYYPTRDAAISALSSAAIQLGRERAGLATPGTG